MATIQDEMNSQVEREKQEKRSKIELEARMKAYEDITIIRRWIKFWSILTIISIIFWIIGEIMTTPA
jgi:hypothetical protein